MGKRLIRWLSYAGSALALPLGSGSDYVRPRRGDNAADFARMVGDMRKVGNDLRTTAIKELRRNGK
jgi:hypothetical protein